MTIISIEGASAAGKTTTSSALARQTGALHIQEVAACWNKPEPEYPEWFFERQADRWSLAAERDRDGLAIIDIDLFQPFWYNWSFDFTLFGGQSLDFVERFYRPLLERRAIGFPDKYFLLSAAEPDLRQRKANDATRLRRGFELNLTFIEPQKRYFQALNAFCPGLVSFIDSVDVESNVTKITSELPSGESRHRYSAELFDHMVNWLRENPASAAD
ncbi:ATP-binding protein [Saccharibacillus alkalitolerans]|uniref:Deoxynucleoside kinase n=1 Tax=Saccharibacillus alkalitolerans TaxID=2705290 RepID=A0ABX0F9X9_9BACL|nr:deoxynucleoside kinase [Saccharibacillus alkalitolerans]NGZ77717.1 deoxynucleoside kinase [Saccharibacillus alkalitolerans]